VSRTVAGDPAANSDEAAPVRHLQPFVREDADGKSLHFTLEALQSRMLPQRPAELALDYTRSMMGFLLFKPAPAHIGMVGLGGGSLAKFCHRQLRDSRMTVLEINPHVIALRREFEVPDDDARFQVIAADGARYLKETSPVFDVLLVDGFDHRGQPAALCSQDFYDDCFAALAPDGVLVVNLHRDDLDHPLRVGRIQRSFGGNAVEVLAEEKGNAIVFACNGPAISPRRISLARSLSALDAGARRQLQGELARVLWDMQHLDPDTF
jgi:spermidine synthase